MNSLPCPPPNILVAEDDPKLRELLVESLADFGFEVSAAPSGRKALDRIRERKPDLLLCDVMMPDGDGHDVLRVIRGDRGLADLPVIFLSALARVSDVRAGMNLGADDYLSKPVALVELRRAVDARLARVQLMRGNCSDPVGPARSLGAEPARFPWPWPDLPGAPAGLGLLAADEGAPRVDTVRAGELAQALCQSQKRAADLLLVVRPGWVQCPPGAFDGTVGTLLNYVLLHSRPGDAIWLVGGWEGERYQLTLWSREGGRNLPGAATVAAAALSVQAGLTRPLDDLGLRRVAAMLRQYGGELQLQDCGADGVRLHAHFTPVPPVP